MDGEVSQRSRARERRQNRLLLFNCSRDWNLRFVPCFVVSNFADASVAELADALDSKSKKLLGNECASECKSEHDRQPRRTWTTVIPSTAGQCILTIAVKKMLERLNGINVRGFSQIIPTRSDVLNVRWIGEIASSHANPQKPPFDSQKMLDTATAILRFAELCDWMSSAVNDNFSCYEKLDHLHFGPLLTGNDAGFVQ